MKGRNLALVSFDNVNLLRKIIKRLRNCSNKTCNEASNEVDVLRFLWSVELYGTQSIRATAHMVVERLLET